MRPTLLSLLAATLVACGSPPPEGSVMRDGRLRPCPATPNCVSTQATDASHQMPPIPFAGSPAEAMARLARVVEGMPRARIVAREGDYLRAEYRSLVFRFVDDVEFVVDSAAGVIHFRSASRVGRGDLGVNRRRMREVTRRFGRE